VIDRRWRRKEKNRESGSSVRGESGKIAEGKVELRDMIQRISNG
jgi:hypothetical protein